MVLSTEWSQVEVIDLINDGSGLGFGIVGGRSTGVVIKSILPGGIADKDNRLQSGDHILQIGDVNLRGFAADQVATVLRQAGSQVRMVVARPVEPSSLDFQNYGCSASIVPTNILTDPEELDRQLLKNDYTTICSTLNCLNSNEANNVDDNKDIINNEIESDIYKKNYCELTKLYNEIKINSIQQEQQLLSNVVNDIIIPSTTLNKRKSITSSSSLSVELELEAETERFSVELNKNKYGLGITIAGYVCEREDLSGIFIKSLNETSEAYKCGKIQINDRIVEVDGIKLNGLKNHEAVEKIKQTSNKVILTLERYIRGPKFEHLQAAFAIQQQKRKSSTLIHSPSINTSFTWIPIETKETQVKIETESLSSEIYDEKTQETKEIFIEENFECNPEDDLETKTKQKWEDIIGSDAEIVVANLVKLKGLGISLEGTVDVEGGIELRPRHYIRSILPEGPVGQNGKLSPGDELLEVNGQKLLGKKHVDVVKILRQLPNSVRLVCSRKHEENRVINTSQDREAFEARNILGGSLKNLLLQPEQRLVKALSDSSINTSSTVTVTDEVNNNNNLEKTKSKSLEIINLAMWSNEIEYIDIVKGDRGLGFSILDYQDPLDPKSTIIVVRSLVPNGAAEHDGRITPGDRLISVNDKIIKNVPLDQAVQALKATLPGIVKLGISKPMTSSSSSSRPISNGIGS